MSRRIAITGMVIVFVALTAVTGFITLLPKLLDGIAVYFPESQDHHGHVAAPSAVDEATVVAIGVALHRQRYRRDASS